MCTITRDSLPHNPTFHCSEDSAPFVHVNLPPLSEYLLAPDLTFEDRKKLRGAKSGEYGGCLRTVTFLLARNYLINKALWAGA